IVYNVPPLVAPGTAGAGPSTEVMSIALPAAPPPPVTEPEGSVLVSPPPPPQAAADIIASTAAAITGFFHRIGWFLLRCRTPCGHGVWFMFCFIVESSGRRRRARRRQAG